MLMMKRLVDSPVVAVVVAVVVLLAVAAAVAVFSCCGWQYE